MSSEITPKLVVLDIAESAYPFSLRGLSMLWLGETVWSRTPLSQVQIHVPCSVEPAAKQTAGLLSLCKCGIYRIYAPCAGLLSHAQFCMAPWTVVQQASLSKEFSRQESLSGLPFPTPEHLLNPGIESVSPALAGGFFAIGATWEAQSLLCALVKYLVVRCDCLYPRGGNQN